MTTRPHHIGPDGPGEPELRSFLGGFVLAARAPLDQKWKVAAILLGSAAGIVGAATWLG